MFYFYIYINHFKYKKNKKCIQAHITFHIFYFEK